MILSFSKFNIESIFEIIATQKDTVEKLKENLSDRYKQVSSSNDVVVTNLRHYNFLIEALDSLEKVKDAIENEIPGDLLSIDLKNVVHYIGEITGEISNDEMLGNIFSNFCIGK